MTDLSRELYLRERLIDHRGPDVFDGTTDRTTRMQRFRDAIRDCGLQSVIIGADNGKPVSWPEAFERCYGEAL